MKTLTSEQFETIIEEIQNKIDYQFNSKFAKVFGVMLNDNLDIQFESIKTGADVYELINDSPEVFAAVNEYDLITIATCGWAAPLNKDNDEDNEIAPSQHPEKRRVRLLTTANTNSQFGSSISFEDNPNEPVFDYGNARGSLADAIVELINTAKKEG